MALVLADRVQETTTTTGTGTVTLLGAVTGFQSFAAIGNANTTYYTIAGQTGSEWEVGIGTYTASGTTLSRTTVLGSSNAGSLVNFSAGTKNVFCSYPAGKSVNKDASGNVTGYAIENSTVGATTPSTGAFTTVNLTGTTDQVSSVAVTANPAAPSAGNLKTFAKSVAGGYTAPTVLNATNPAFQLQPSLANKRIAYHAIANGFANFTNLLIAAPVSSTATLANVASTSFYTRVARLIFTSAATAGSVAYFNGSNACSIFTLGTATTPAYGGFYCTIKFSISDAVASPRTFVGLASGIGTPTNVEPSTLINSIGVGQGAANTNLFIYYGGTAAQTPINLGASFPTNTNAVDWYELTLFAPPTSDNTVYYQVLRMNTGDVAIGTLTGTAGTALPSNTLTLSARTWRSNNATASAVTIASGGFYGEMDY
jgi:hypothetical protein